jgi:thiamine biosynthesis lipoprotein
MLAHEQLVRFPAFGSTAVVAVAEPGRLWPAVGEVERIVDSFDVACSRFRSDSELTALNAAAGTTVAVGAILFEAISASLRAARLTDGAVDPTVGRALVALGYDRDFAGVGGRDRSRQLSIVSVPGWRTVKLDAEARTVRLSRGVALDLGATAKALAADRAAAAASSVAGCGVLVSFGGDIAIAGAPPAGGWPVRVADDHRSDIEAPGQWITLRSGGLATSSTTTRRWSDSSGPVHHLIDPATGSSARSLYRTVTVAAGSCLDANIASTASIVRSERADAWLESLRLPGRLVGLAGGVRHVAGWPEQGDDLS